MTPMEFARRFDALQNERVANKQKQDARVKFARNLDVLQAARVKLARKLDALHDADSCTTNRVRFTYEDVSVSKWSYTAVMMLILALCFVLLHYVYTPEGRALACKTAGKWGIYTGEVKEPVVIDYTVIVRKCILLICYSFGRG